MAQLQTLNNALQITMYDVALLNSSDLELYLGADEQWPKTLEGLCSLIDSADDEAHGYCWLIAGFEAIGFTDQIGIEFKQAVLKHVKTFLKNIKVVTGPQAEGYYQVVDCTIS